MIDSDLSNAYAFATVALENDHYWDPDNAPLDLKAWNDYCAILAPAVSSDAWLKIRFGVDAIRNLNGYREMEAATAVGRSIFPPLSSTFKQAVAKAADTIDDAREALAPLCYESRGAPAPEA